MLQVLITIFTITAVLSASNLEAQSHNFTESNNENCSNLINKPCNDQEQKIYELWIEMLDQNYKMQEDYVKKISQEILIKCEELNISKSLCELVSLEAMLKANKTESQEQTDELLALLLNQDLLFSSIDTSIYLSMEYLRLLNIYSWEDQLIDKLGNAILDEALRVDLASKDPWIVGEIYFGLATYQKDIEVNWSKAIELYYKALEFFEISEDIESIIWSYYYIGDAQYAEGKLNQARETVVSALSSSSEYEQETNDIRLQLLSLLANIEIALGSGRESKIGRDLIDLYQETFYGGKWNQSYDSDFAFDIAKYLFFFNCVEKANLFEFFNDVINYRDDRYVNNEYYLESKQELESVYISIAFQKWACLSDELREDNPKLYAKETNKFLKLIEDVLDDTEYKISYFESSAYAADLYSYLWYFDGANMFDDYPSKNFYKKITSIAENWLNQIIEEDLNDNLGEGFSLLSIFAHASSGTNNRDDAHEYIEKLESFLDKFTKLGAMQDAAKSRSVTRLFHLSTVVLYEHGYEKAAEKIYKKYFLSLDQDPDKAFSEIVQRVNVYEETNFIMSADILIDEDIHLIRNNENESYEFELLNRNLESRMHLNRSKYEVLALKDFFADPNIKDAIQAYLDSNSEIERVKFDGSFLDNKNLDNYLDLINKTKKIGADQKEALISEFFPDVNFLDYQKQLKRDETLIIQTVVDVDYSIYFYSLMITDEDYVISRWNLYDFIMPFIGEDEWIDLINPKENLVLVWLKYIEAIKENYFNEKNYKDIGKSLSELHLYEMKEFIENRNKLIFINDFNSVFSPDLLFYEDGFLAEQFEISQYISLFDFLNRNKDPLSYKNYFGFAAQEFNPVFKVDSLKNTTNEIERSSKFFKNKINYINQEFSKEILNRPQYQDSVLHFATHNIQVENNIFGDVPALLTGNIANKEYLDIFNISNLKLDNSFILLAACNTTQIMKNDLDAFSGLVKSFKLAGAEQVFATRWEIETLSSEKFIVSYLGKIADGIEANAALALTKREFIKDKELNHPIFWGAFTLIN